MQLGYFYATVQSTEQNFSFNVIPEILYTNPVFKKISSDAKLLYGTFLSRVNLSSRCNWRDKEGRVYIRFSVRKVMERLNCAKEKALDVLAELTRCGLIETAKSGIIYVKNALSAKDVEPEQAPAGEPEQQEQQDEQAAAAETTEPEEENAAPADKPDEPKAEVRAPEENKKEGAIYKYIYNSSIAFNKALEESNQNHNTGADVENFDRTEFWKLSDVLTRRATCEQKLRWNIDFDALRRKYPDSKTYIDQILLLLVDALASDEKEYRINREKKPATAVQAQLLALRTEHVEKVLDNLQTWAREIAHPREYLLTALYNAPLNCGTRQFRRDGFTD
jgi:hypothetical protein